MELFWPQDWPWAQQLKFALGSLIQRSLQRTIIALLGPRYPVDNFALPLSPNDVPEIMGRNINYQSLLLLGKIVILCKKYPGPSLTSSSRSSSKQGPAAVMLMLEILKVNIGLKVEAMFLASGCSSRPPCSVIECVFYKNQLTTGGHVVPSW